MCLLVEILFDDILYSGVAIFNLIWIILAHSSGLFEKMGFLVRGRVDWTSTHIVVTSLLSKGRELRLVLARWDLSTVVPWIFFGFFLFYFLLLLLFEALWGLLLLIWHFKYKIITNPDTGAINRPHTSTKVRAIIWGWWGKLGESCVGKRVST